MPENRAQTALLLWNTAGRPEPAEAPAFKDVADPDTAKAAQWCVEHGLMDQKLGGRFAPDNSDPAYKTLNAYRSWWGNKTNPLSHCFAMPAPPKGELIAAFW